MDPRLLQKRLIWWFQAATENDDVIFGGEGDDVVYGGEGADTIDGGEGDDYLDGGAGHDVFKASRGDDRIISGGGVDTLAFTGDQRITNIQYVDADTDGFSDDLVFSFNYSGDSEADAVQSVTVLNQTTDAVELVKFDFDRDGSIEDSTEKFRLASSLDAGSSTTNTIIVGTNSSDEIGGGLKSDVIYGYGGDDKISGRAGNDQIDGGEGIDTATFAESSGRCHCRPCGGDGVWHIDR